MLLLGKTEQDLRGEELYRELSQGAVRKDLWEHYSRFFWNDKWPEGEIYNPDRFWRIDYTERLAVLVEASMGYRSQDHRVDMLALKLIRDAATVARYSDTALSSRALKAEILELDRWRSDGLQIQPFNDRLKIRCWRDLRDRLDNHRKISVKLVDHHTMESKRTVAHFRMKFSVSGRGELRAKVAKSQGAFSALEVVTNEFLEDFERRKSLIPVAKEIQLSAIPEQRFLKFYGALKGLLPHVDFSAKDFMPFGAHRLVRTESLMVLHENLELQIHRCGLCHRIEDCSIHGYLADFSEDGLLELRESLDELRECRC